MGERDAAYSLENDNSIIIKETDKGSAVVVWDREDYLKWQKTNLMIKMFVRNLQEMWKVFLRKSSKLSSEIGDISDNTLRLFPSQ